MKWFVYERRFVELSVLDSFLRPDDPRPAAQQFQERYRFGGWQPFRGFTLTENNRLTYPEDPPRRPVASTKLRDELIILYPGDWVAIIQPDRSFEVCRMD